MEKYRIHFLDEAPRIGSGVRGVVVNKRGRKWVSIQEIATGVRVKMLVSTFEKITAGVEPAPVRRRRRRTTP
jgi:hypothetical protein